MLVLEIVLAVILLVLIYFMVDMVMAIKFWVSHEEELFKKYDEKLNGVTNTLYEMKFSDNDILGQLNNLRLLVCYLSLLITDTDTMLESISDEELEEYIEHYKNDSQKPEGYQILFDEYVRRQEEKKNNTEK